MAGLLSRAWGATVGRLADRVEANNVAYVQDWESRTGEPHWCRLPDENGVRIGDPEDTALWTVGWRKAATSPSPLNGTED